MSGAEPSAASRTLHGILLAVAAVACFAALDTSTKVVGPAVPVLLAMWCRFTFQAVATAAALLPVRGRALLVTRRPALQLLRGLLLLGCSICAFLSFRRMPVGDVTSILMLTPVIVMLVAVFAYGERLSPLRVACVVGGLAGALLIIRPGGSAFGWGVLMPLAAMALNTGFQLVTGRLAIVDDPGTTHFYTGCIGAALTTLALPWVWTTAFDRWLWAVLLLMGAFGTVGHFLLILAYQRAPVTTVTPFLYAQIGFAVLGGWLVFAHAPDGWSWLGIGLIAACGAFGTWLAAREKRYAEALAAQPVNP